MDDEPFIRDAFKLYLETQGYEVTAANDGATALEVFRADPVEVVLLDLVMPGMQGLDILRRLRAIDPSVEVIIATGCGSMSSAIEALRLGAFDYITKPILDFERDLLGVVRMAHSQHQDNAEKRIEPTAGVIPASADTVRFYAELEALTSVVCSAHSRADAFTDVEEFFRSQVGATAGLLVEEDPDNSVSTLGWGRLTELHVGDGPPIEGSVLDRLCETSAPDSWTRVPTGSWRSASGARLPTKDAPVEYWMIPLTPSTSAIDRPHTLLVFRPAEDSRCETPPPYGLLAVVIEAALSKEAQPALS